MSALKERDHFFLSAIAMMAVGVSAANCDGEIHDEERRVIEQFVAGINTSSFPKKVKNKIEDIYNEQPNLKTAFKLAKKAGVPMSVCEDIIKVVIGSDGTLRDEETAFLVAWSRMAAA